VCVCIHTVIHTHINCLIADGAEALVEDAACVLCMCPSTTTIESI
jgi:hypothetical protein